MNPQSPHRAHEPPTADPPIAGKPPAERDLASDLERASRLLSLARDLLVRESEPFPALEAARRLKIRQESKAFRIAHLARELAGGARDDRQLARAIEILDVIRAAPVLAALRTLQELDPRARSIAASLIAPEPKRRRSRA